MFAVALAAHGVSAKGAVSCPVVLKNTYGAYLSWYAALRGADGDIVKWYKYFAHKVDYVKQDGTSVSEQIA
mgnify:CR=1 FL=1|tara:strand:+ start:140 stop:352 length:213 start_codon:yes stop_codon:yes gene_type:complete